MLSVSKRDVKQSFFIFIFIFINTGPAELSHIHTLSGDDKLAILFEKLVDIEEKLPSVRELQSTVETVRQRTINAETSIKSDEQQVKILNYKSVDIEARSRRNNLIFRGLYEGYNEDCVFVLKQFLNNELRLNPEDIIIKRAHRLGKKVRTGFSKRPLIAAFNNYADTEKILKNARFLRGTSFSVARDYSAEITKLLWPRLKELRQNKRNAILLRYVILHNW